MTTRVEMAASGREYDAAALEIAARVVRRRKVTTEGWNTGAVARALTEEAAACRAEARAIREQG